MMVISKKCFLFLLLHTLSTVSFPDTDSGYPKIQNHDCCCFSNNIKNLERLSNKEIIFVGQVQKAVTGLIIAMVLLNIIVYKLRQLHDKSLLTVGEDQKNKPPSNLSSENYLCRRFMLSDMQLATNNFDQSTIIGKGGYGTVYKGFIDDGATTVAIKRLESKSKQGGTEFWTEIKTLSKFRHSHLATLIGYCNESDEMMIVYEYIANGNLGEHLHGTSKNYPLSWVTRLKICIGAARALDYLHTGTGVHQRIIHRDVKSSNILLDENMAAKLSDFGISKIGPVDQGCTTHVSTEVKGSFGYFDPNYFLTGRLTRKSDVYSFGVVLLEVLCGRPAVDRNLVDNELGLVRWAQRFIKEGMINDIIDPNLMGLTPCLRVKGQIMPDCLKAYVEICEKCLKSRPKERPTMSEVVVALEAAMALQDRGDYFVVDEKDKRANSKQYTKSGNMIMLSRMLRNIIPVKTALRSEPLEKKKRLEKWSLPLRFSSKEGLPRKSEDIFQEFNVANSGLKIFSLDELKCATRNFSNDMVVGEGAFGKVYKGWIEVATFVPCKLGFGIPIAVKNLDPDGYQGYEEWQSEVKLLSKLSHPNLVKLLGCCSQDKDLLLVYEFLQKGGLENYILKKGLDQTLSWSTRVKIMIGTAQGLAFLHARENQIIFRDLKTSNILLDEDFNAKVADFGLARRGPINGETHLSTQVMGTYGYAAPEYVATGYLNGKNDIYSFGVVLLETLTGLRVYDKTRPNKEQNLVKWMRPILPNKKKLKSIIDPSLGQDYPPETAAYQYAQLILKCTQPEPKDRPPIEHVLHSLQRISGIKTKVFKGGRS